MDSSPSSQDAGHLLHNLVLFGRMLREAGLDINPEQQIAIVKALGHVNMAREEEFYHTIRCLVVNEFEEIPLFDIAFDLFWRKPGQQGHMFHLSDGKKPNQTRANQSNQHERGRKSTIPRLELSSDESKVDPNDEEKKPDLSQSYSALEMLRQKDFAELDPDELSEVKYLISQLVWQLGHRRSRRFRPGRGSAIDVRRSYRRNLQHGGEILGWRYRQPKNKPRPLVVIADISGSMERYTNLLLHFTFGLATNLDQTVESFVFSTRLTRITFLLRSKNVNKVIEDISDRVPDWSGGTRIGEALKRFNYNWSRRILGHRAVVLLISDGWDRGSPALLAHEIARLQRNCHRLIWLNPLLGSPDYKPLTRGMQAALPYIDDFVPVHNLASLEMLANALINLNGGHSFQDYKERQLAVY